MLITYTLKQSADGRECKHGYSRRDEIYKWFNSNGNRKINPIHVREVSGLEQFRAQGELRV